MPKFKTHKEFSQDNGWEVETWHLSPTQCSISYHQYFRCICGSGNHTVEVSIEDCGPMDEAPYIFNVCWLAESESSFIPLWGRIRAAFNYVLRRDRQLYHHILTMDEPTYEKFAKAVNDAKELVKKLNEQYAIQEAQRETK